MVQRPTVEEVTAGYHGDPVGVGDLASSGDFDNPDDAERLILEAVSMFDNVFGDDVLFLNEVEDEANAVRLLARHKWAIALGDTIESEGQAGSNVTYTGTGTGRSLSRTEYGQEFLEYKDDTNANIGVFRTQ